MERPVEDQMQRILDQLDIQLHVIWTPTPNQTTHGKVDLPSKTLFLFDATEQEAWQTFSHEVLEYTFMEVANTYRAIINGLIDTLEQVAYRRKEHFLNALPRIFALMKEEQDP